ncbi:hypothetical protein STSP2_02634 [Anaerohalosphaera lusitana]|uniref:Uncharacterized protein n=1 Tax=Anaerohalosphaera lusitana TaxID=1936003 RepID=A0A1U9NNY7_9BACT|nr:LamG-like jellyroll fold domain-containing protein [Anaerohalosphaera lusitana]AQT69444.1 hypothetical protein STSP2_02634 [Anaerohalosphaera lusitana]
MRAKMYLNRTIKSLFVLAIIFVFAPFLRGAPQSDYFDSDQVKSFWRYDDPMLDTTQTVTGNSLVLQVPAGPSHGHPGCFDAEPYERVLYMLMEDDPSDGVLDSSLYENHGLVTVDSSPTLVSGVIGSAYEFDGVDDRVQIPYSQSLDPDYITVSAWINADSASDARIVCKSAGTEVGDHVFSLGVYPSGGRLIPRVRISTTGGAVSVDGTISFATDTWTHLAFTYDGLNIKLYVDGQPAGEYAHSGMITSSSLDTVIGNINLSDSRYFDGVIDEVQIYNVPLSEESIADIAAQQDAWAEIGTRRFASLLQPTNDADFDVSAKFASDLQTDGQLQGLVVSQDSQNYLTFDVIRHGGESYLTINKIENDMVTYRTVSTVEFTAPYYLRMERGQDSYSFYYSFDGFQWSILETLAWTSSNSEVGLLAGNYGWANDAPAFTSIVDHFISEQVDVDPPVISDIEILTGGDKAMICWTTDEPAESQIDYGLTDQYEIGYLFDPELKSQHSMQISGLDQLVEYHCLITCTDSAGNTAHSSDMVFSTDDTVDNVPPILGTPGVTVEEDRASIVWSSDEPCTTVLDYGLTEQYAVGSFAGNEWTTYHAVELTGLSPSTTYHFQISGLDAALNETVDSGYTFTTSEPDITPPVISELTVYPMASSCELSWVTDEPATTLVRYGETEAYELGEYNVNTLQSVHSIVLTDLVPGASYYYMISCTDKRDNTTEVQGQFVTSTQCVIQLITEGEGTVLADPNKATYGVGEMLQLTAVPSDGYKFAYWGGSVQSTETEVSMSVTEDEKVFAHFVPEDACLEQFNGNTFEESVWKFVNPIGDGQWDVLDGHLNISVPYGPSHLISTRGTKAPRLVQNVSEDNFRAVVKFNSQGGAGTRFQGLMAEDDYLNFAKIEAFSSDTENGVYVSRFVAGSQKNWPDDEIDAYGHIYLAIERVQDTYQFEYSFDGGNWTTLREMTLPFSVSKVAVFGGNHSLNGEAPAAVASADFFINTVPPVTKFDGDPSKNTVRFSTFGSGEVRTVASPICIENNNYADTGDFDNDCFVTFGDFAAMATQWLLVGDGLMCDIAGSDDTVDYADLERFATFWLNDYYDRDPNRSEFVIGETIGISASPDEGWGFVGYRGAVESQMNPSELEIEGDHFIETYFDPVPGSNAIDVWYGKRQEFGQNGTPQRFVNILGSIAEPQTLERLDYAVNGVYQLPLSLGPEDNLRLTSEGDFNAEIPLTVLEPGLNYVTLTAVMSDGSRASDTVTVVYNDQMHPPANYSIDWSEAGSINDAAQVTDGLWELSDQGVTSIVPGYDRCIAVGDMSWQDYEVIVPIKMLSSNHDPNQPGGLPSFGIVMRWTGHVEWRHHDQPRIGWKPLGALARFQFRNQEDEPTDGVFQILGHEGNIVATGDAAPLEYNREYIFKMRCKTLATSETEYSFKVWPSDEQEPVHWTMVATEPATAPQHGSFILLTHHTEVLFGDVTVTPVQ